MQEPQFPPNEQQRLCALQQLCILDTPPEERLDRITRIATHFFNVPIALISLVDAQRQWFKSRQGLNVSELPRSISFCGHTILGNTAMVVPDTLRDPRFADNPLVQNEPHIRFYAGYPLSAADGSKLGTLCLIDRRPRKLRAADLEVLRDLAAWAEEEVNNLSRRQAKAELAKRSRQLDAVFSLSPDGFVLFGAGRVVRVNQAFLNLTGLAENDLIGLDEHAFDAALAARCDPEHPYPACWQYWGKGKSTPQFAGRGFSAREQAIADNLQLFHLLRQRKILKRSLQQGQDEGQGADRVMYFRDVTHEADVARMKSEFLSTAAHELRTPLASIYGFVELLLQRDYDAATRRDLLERVYRQAGNLARLLNELLDLSRIEMRAGKDFEIRPQPLAPIIRHACSALLTPENPRDITIRIPEDLPDVALDAEKFEQVLINVLSNSLKYSSRDAPVELWVDLRETATGRQACVHIKDCGIGMTPEQVERIFERFYRADKNSAISGAGLGMTLVKEIIEMHGGRVEVEGELGKGTEVCLYLPVIRKRRKRGNSASAAAARSTNQNE